ncbi:unnamed protein product, partial [Gongylonema pulchrum]|uniref:Translation initiation factor if-2 n=1 Tax=Gongylonema pulchrum TaxID=637853 RepID=A0A183EM40_9BILA
GGVPGVAQQTAAPVPAAPVPQGVPAVGVDPNAAHNYSGYFAPTGGPAQGQNGTAAPAYGSASAPAYGAMPQAPSRAHNYSGYFAPTGGPAQGQNGTAAPAYGSASAPAYGAMPQAPSRGAPPPQAHPGAMMGKPGGYGEFQDDRGPRGGGYGSFFNASSIADDRFGGRPDDRGGRDDRGPRGFDRDRGGYGDRDRDRGSRDERGGRERPSRWGDERGSDRGSDGFRGGSVFLHIFKYKLGFFSCEFLKGIHLKTDSSGYLCVLYVFRKASSVDKLRVWSLYLRKKAVV